MKRVITYGTFDLFHIGHLNLLKRAKKMGDYLVVGISTDEFNEIKGKKCICSFEDRKKIVESIIYVDKVIPEKEWIQKENDIISHKIDIFTIGDDWKGKFDNLKTLCKVKYLPRTPKISSSNFKNDINKNKY